MRNHPVRQPPPDPDLARNAPRVRTWEDADAWADHADDHGVECPVCGAKICNLDLLGEMVRRTKDHLATAHPDVIDGAVCP